MECNTPKSAFCWGSLAQNLKRNLSSVAVLGALKSAREVKEVKPKLSGKNGGERFWFQCFACFWLNSDERPEIKEEKPCKAGNSNEGYKILSVMSETKPMQKCEG